MGRTMLDRSHAPTSRRRQPGDGDAQVALNGGGDSALPTAAQLKDRLFDESAKTSHLGSQGLQLMETLNDLGSAPAADHIQRRLRPCGNHQRSLLPRP